MSKKIVVVGAGVVGASIAYYLSKNGADVTVLEKNHSACEASGSSFGWLNANFPESKDYFALRQASLEEYPQLLNQLAVDVEAQFNGCLFWELQGKELIAHCKALQELNYPVELIDATEFSRLEPDLASPPELAMKSSSEGAVDPEKLTKSLIQNSSIEFFEQCELTGFIKKDNKVIGVQTTQGDYFADTTVIAVGKSAQKILSQLGVYLPMNNRKGFIITTKPTAPLINRVLFGKDIHFKQHEDGKIVIGDWLHDINGDVDLEEIAQRTMNRFSTYFPGQDNLQIEKITCAYRPMPEDGYSVVGSPKDYDGLYIASTHSGVTLAPIIGKLASKEILGSKKSELLKSFRIERFNQ